MLRVGPGLHAALRAANVVLFERGLRLSRRLARIRRDVRAREGAQLTVRLVKPIVVG